MSMLAEPRKKHKWTLNPRGKDWSNDTTKFGHRMLEKMGWSIGKGLGVNEQGMVEHVKVKVKNDTVGIGFKEKEEAWTECQKEFNNFLTMLQKAQDSCVTQEIRKKNSVGNGQSLEFKSKQSRTRVHYHKFTRGKDVQRYSSKDLANILGHTSIINKNTDIQEELKEEQKQDELNTLETREGIITINSGNMNDYFKNKNSRLYKDLKDNNVLEDNASEDDGTCYAGFGFKSGNFDSSKNKTSMSGSNYFFENPCLDLNDSNDTVVSEKNSFKKRKGTLISEDEKQLDHERSNSTENLRKKMKLDIISNKRYKEGIVNIGLDLNNQNDSSCVIDNKFEVPREEFGLTNNALDLSDENCGKKKVTFNNHVEYSTDSTKKTFITTLDKFEVNSKKRKKKRKHDKENAEINSNSLGIVNKALDIDPMHEEIYDNELDECENKKEKKKKHRRMSNLETIEETQEEDTEVPLTTQENSTDVNLNQTLNSEPETLSEEKKLKKLKKKKKKKEKIEEFEIQQEINTLNENKKKKKHKKHENILIENITNTFVKEKQLKKAKHRKNKTKETYGKTECEKDVENKSSEKTNKDETVVVTETNVIYEKGEEKYEATSTSTSETIQESSVLETECITIEDIIDSLGKKRSRISKKALKMLFNGGYVSTFPGANLESIKGYGV